MVQSLWCGLRGMVCIVWSPQCVLHSVVSTVQSPWCGLHPVSSWYDLCLCGVIFMVQSPQYGLHGVVFVVWSPWCSLHDVVSTVFSSWANPALSSSSHAPHVNSGPLAFPSMKSFCWFLLFWYYHGNIAFLSPSSSFFLIAGSIPSHTSLPT